MRRRIKFYVALVLILFAAVTEASFLFINHITTDYANESTLKKVVQQAVENIEYEDDEIEFDDVDLYADNVVVTIYNAKGKVLLGTPVVGLETITTFKPGEFYEAKVNGNHYFVYDLKHTYGTQTFYVRGVYVTNGHQSPIRAAVYAFIVVLPIGIILAIAISSVFINRTFKPVSDLTQTADQIAKSNDLHQRLPLDETQHDELYDLASSLNDMLDQLETALEREREFTADVSHEIKTPLSAMLLECDNALSGSTEEEYRESLEHIKQQVRQLMNMVHQLLDMSRSLSKEDVMNLDSFDLSVVCESIIEQYMELYPDIIFESDIDEDVTVVADETLIMRMLMNLLNNAIRYTTESPHIIVRLKQGHDVELSVEDNGIGIKKEDQAKIFNRFYKVDGARQTDDHFGLGLSMVKWIAEAHQGTVSVESEWQQGTTFKVRLPNNHNVL